MIYVPPYYRDKNSHNAAKIEITNDAAQVLDKALEYKVSRYSSVIESELVHEANIFMAKYNSYKEKFFDDTELVIATRMIPFLEAVKMLLVDSPSSKDLQAFRDKFLQWARKVYIPSAKLMVEGWTHKKSNHGAWGWAGLYLVSIIMGDSWSGSTPITSTGYYPSQILKKIHKELKNPPEQPRWVKLFGDYHKSKYEFWVENMRTKSGLYYTHYRLVAYLKMAQHSLTDTDREKLLEAMLPHMALFVHRAKGGESDWPYMKKTRVPILRQIQDILFPSGKEFRPYWPNGKMAGLVHVYVHMTGMEPDIQINLGANYNYFPFPRLHEQIRIGFIPRKGR